MADMRSVVERIADVQGRVRRAAALAGRDANDVTLIAVSKTFVAQDIVPVLEIGHKTFGENRVQEARDKWPKLKEQFPDCSLHLIGPLQSNKVRDAIVLFDAIHSLDRESVADAIAKEFARTERRPTLFVQVNTGLEPQKSGVAPKETPAFVRRLREVHGLSPQGLMCIPPEADDPGPHFAMLRQVARDCELPFLSMGMSADYDVAVKLGSTHIRVGSAIFGGRHLPSSI